MTAGQEAAASRRGAPVRGAIWMTGAALGFATAIAQPAALSMKRASSMSSSVRLPASWVARVTSTLL